MHIKRIIGLVFLYYPQINELILNILAYIDHIDLLILWTNYPISKEDCALLTEIRSEKIQIFGNGENIGIGKPINIVLERYNTSYEFLLTMDQDSTWLNFKEYIDCIYENFDSFKKDSILVYGPQIITVYQETGKLANNLLVDHVITSGAIYSMKLFELIGGFREDYFIDALDEEICWRASKYGLKTIQISKGRLLQRYGISSERKFFDRHIIYMQHNTMRNFYIVRNHIYLLREYKPCLKVYMKIMYRYVIVAGIKIILYDKNPISKLSAIFKGISHGLRIPIKVLKANYPIFKNNKYNTD